MLDKELASQRVCKTLSMLNAKLLRFNNDLSITTQKKTKSGNGYKQKELLKCIGEINMIKSGNKELLQAIQTYDSPIDYFNSIKQ